MTQIDQRAAAEGIGTVAASERPFAPLSSIDRTIFTSGNTSQITGELGREIDVETGRDAAVQAIVRLLSAVHTHLGTLSAVRVVAIKVFVRSAPDFQDQPRVADAASELINRVFGEELPRHARSAIGVAALPNGAAVEIEAILERG